jgi:isocitrate dehydrogenase
VVECKRLISAPGCDQVHREAFETAQRLGFTRVHCGHKANIMKMTDGLFLERFYAAAADFPEIETADVIIDALCMNLVLRPHEYQMVVLPNLQGDIVSDLAAGLVGGLGFAPSANIGQHVSIFEAVHGTAPDIAGKGIANPTSLLLSGLMMLRHVGLLKQAATIENALLATLEAGVRTGDFGDKSREAVGTQKFADEVIARLGKQPTSRPPVEATQNEVRFTRPERPRANTLLRTFHTTVSHICGADIYIETLDPGRRTGSRPAAAVRADTVSTHAHLQPRHAGVADGERLHRGGGLLPGPLRAARCCKDRPARPGAGGGPAAQAEREVPDCSLRAAADV